MFGQGLHALIYDLRFAIDEFEMQFSTVFAG
jgi:hypothetical protein